MSVSTPEEKGLDREEVRETVLDEFDVAEGDSEWAEEDLTEIAAEARAAGDENAARVAEAAMDEIEDEADYGRTPGTFADEDDESDEDDEDDFLDEFGDDYSDKDDESLEELLEELEEADEEDFDEDDDYL